MDTFTGRNGLFTGTGNPEVLGGRVSRNVGIMFPFMAIFIDRGTACTKKAPLMVLNSEYSARIRLITNQGGFNVLQNTELNSMKDKFVKRTRIGVEMFQNRCGNAVFTLKFSTLHHPVGDLGRLGAWSCYMHHRLNESMCK